MNALYKLSYGLYIVSTKADEKLNGQIANVAFQITDDPARVVVCLNKKNLTNEMVAKNGKFAISILSQNATMPQIGLFGFKSGRDVEKFKEIKYKITENNLPIPLDNVIGYIEVEVEKTVDIPDYTMFIGKVINTEYISDDPPMTYEYYHKVKKGKAPKTAPTFSLNNIKE